MLSLVNIEPFQIHIIDVCLYFHGTLPDDILHMVLYICPPSFLLGYELLTMIGYALRFQDIAQLDHVVQMKPVGACWLTSDVYMSYNNDCPCGNWAVHRQQFSTVYLQCPFWWLLPPKSVTGLSRSWLVPSFCLFKKLYTSLCQCQYFPGCCLWAEY